MKRCFVESYKKTDEDLFVVESSFLKVYHGSFSLNPPGKTTRLKKYFHTKMGSGKYRLKIEGRHSDGGTHKIRITCDTKKMTPTTLKNWPIEMNFKYSN